MGDKDDTKDEDREDAADKADEPEDRDEESEESDDDDERESPAPPPPKSETKPSKSSKAGRSGKLRREKKSGVRAEHAQESARPASRQALVRGIMVAVVALAAGGAAGWFGHDARAKAKLRTESAPATAGSGGPCTDWEQKICAESGERSAACQQAKGATELLTPGTCDAALVAVPATLAKVKAARVSCDTLVTKLCNNLPKDSNACQMVKDRAPSFPSERCKGMLGEYDQVLNQLKMIDAQGGMMGRPPGGGPPGANPHAPPPGAVPRGAPPGAVPHTEPHP